MKLHVDYDWSVKKLAETPDDEQCGAGVPLEKLNPITVGLWECVKCGFVYDRHTRDCINCNPPPTRS